jgi:hypothetical protein
MFFALLSSIIERVFRKCLCSRLCGRLLSLVDFRDNTDSKAHLVLAGSFRAVYPIIPASHCWLNGPPLMRCVDGAFFFVLHSFEYDTVSLNVLTCRCSAQVELSASLDKQVSR